MRSLTSVYWIPPNEFSTRRGFQQPDHHLGFAIERPLKLPRSAGMYFGQNPVPDRRELIFTPFTALTGRIPYSNGRPLIDPKSREAVFDRKKYILSV